jgi:hypothetical protein
VPPSAEDPLVAQAFDTKNHDDLARAIKQLSPEEAAFFLHRLEGALRKRKIQLTGYLVAMAAWLAGMTLALIYFGMHDGPVVWVFIAPFGVVGVILYAFGTWSERVARAPLPVARSPLSAPACGAQGAQARVSRASVRDRLLGARFGRGARQGHGERSAGAELAVDGDRAAVGDDDRPGDVQS